MQFRIYIYHFFTCIIINIKNRPREQKCIVFFLLEKIFFWRSTRSRSSRLEFAREENRNPRFVVDRHWNIRSFYIDRRKKSPI